MTEMQGKYKHVDIHYSIAFNISLRRNLHNNDKPKNPCNFAYCHSTYKCFLVVEYPELQIRNQSTFPSDNLSYTPTVQMKKNVR